MNKQNAKRWGLVTFCAGVTCGTLGHYLPAPLAHMIYVSVAVLVALAGTISVESDDGN